MSRQELKRIRKGLNLTQRQFAERIGIAPNTIARQERGERPISEPVMRLARLLKKKT